MNRHYKINPSYTGDFINKIGEIATLMYINEIPIGEIENILATSPIIEELLEGNTGLISTLSVSLTALIFYHEPDTPHVHLVPNVLDKNRLAVGVHPMTWCGRVLAMYIVERECSMRQALEVFSLEKLMKAYGQYHFAPERLALQELFGLDEDVVIC